MPNFECAVNPLERRGPLTITDADKSKKRSDGIPFMRRMDLVDSYFPIESVAGSLPEGLGVRH